MLIEHTQLFALVLYYHSITLTCRAPPEPLLLLFDILPPGPPQSVNPQRVFVLERIEMGSPPLSQALF